MYTGAFAFILHMVAIKELAIIHDTKWAADIVWLLIQKEIVWLLQSSK